MSIMAVLIDISFAKLLSLSGIACVIAGLSAKRHSTILCTTLCASAADSVLVAALHTISPPGPLDLVGFLVGIAVPYGIGCLTRSLRRRRLQQPSRAGCELVERPSP